MGLCRVGVVITRIVILLQISPRCIPFTGGIERWQYPGPGIATRIRDFHPGTVRRSDGRTGLWLRLVCGEHLRPGLAGDQEDLAYHRSASGLYRFYFLARLHHRHHWLRI